ncbi:ABC transporter substrate-binding protein [Desulfitobacterium chlororespirans]|uniref:Iron complex transport system substrate-binding protein n=1 Tax=Desulfitobacterium chlororespirans DSM 11544 TaxID=1121395 RepID=A0A1M7TWW5_9FIRM|nr:ABC transporter substrate-binding protein [Desulfitobacterium chlororespirans]SHN75218.1 iron complex transport system substrate-binding protein [Desulfitobacterium chlororespirans DSM 11544]
MRKILIPLLLTALILCSLAGCETKPSNPTKANITNNTALPPSAAQTRIITDLGGNEVAIPSISEIKQVVIITPPVTSVLLEAIPDKNMIVGLSPKAFAFSNADIMAKLFPNYTDVDTTFVGDDFSINTEALLQLNPDIILYYGEVQKKGLANIGLPIINFFSPKLTDPKDVTVAWDNLLREIFDADTNEGLQSEWQLSDERVAELLAKQTGEPKRALCVFSNVGGSLVVSGSSSFDSYAQSFFDKAGLINVAADIEGTAEVDMEQIYNWNPDLIFIFHNAPAKAFLANSIAGQDWSLLDAWKNKAIYDIPQTAYSWGAPCADSPMMPLWLISKAYPELLSENDFRAELTNYYERLHRVTLTDGDITSILSLREAR